MLVKAKSIFGYLQYAKGVCNLLEMVSNPCFSRVALAGLLLQELVESLA
jgi:hypothetical protein